MDLQKLNYISPPSLGFLMGLISMVCTTLICGPIIIKLIIGITVKQLSITLLIFPAFMLIFMPIFGYLLGRILAVIFNWYSRQYGGLEISLSANEPNS